MEKGQVTLFVIVGIIVLFLVVLVLYLSSESVRSVFREQRSRIIGVPQEFELADSYLASCVEQTAINSINNVALQGGFYNPSDAALVPRDLGQQEETQALIGLIGTSRTLNVSQRYIPVAYWYKGQDVSPSRQQLEQELSEYFDDFLERCLDDRFEELIDRGYRFSAPQVSSQFSVARDAVAVEASYPVSVEYRGASFTPEDRTVEVPSSLFDLFSVGKSTVAAISRDPEMIPFSGLSDTGFRVNVFENEGDVIYSVADNRTVMTFAVQA